MTKIYSEDNGPKQAKNAAIANAIFGKPLNGVGFPAFVGGADLVVFSKGAEVVVWSISKDEAVFRRAGAAWPVASARRHRFAFAEGESVIIWDVDENREVARLTDDMTKLARRFRTTADSIRVLPLALLQDGDLLVTRTIVEGSGTRELVYWPKASW